MKERGIIFKGEMVRAILEDRKTQTRRIVKPQPLYDSSVDLPKLLQERAWVNSLPCPYGTPRDKLYVRETWRPAQIEGEVWYRAGVKATPGYGKEWITVHDSHLGTDGKNKWRPSIYMFRKNSRIILEITNVRVERLQDITEEDSLAEGSQIPCGQLPKSCQQATMTERAQFSRIWDSINAKKYPWKSNPWVWALTLKRIVEYPR